MKRLRFNWIVGASIAGLAAIIILGFFEYLSDNQETDADRLILYTLIILISVLIGAAIVFEALRHFGKDEPDNGLTAEREERSEEPGTE